MKNWFWILLALIVISCKSKEKGIPENRLCYLYPADTACSAMNYDLSIPELVGYFDEEKEVAVNTEIKRKIFDKISNKDKLIEDAEVQCDSKDKPGFVPKFIGQECKSISYSINWVQNRTEDENDSVLVFEIEIFEKLKNKMRVDNRFLLSVNKATHEVEMEKRQYKE